MPGSHGFLGAILTSGNSLPDGLVTVAALDQLRSSRGKAGAREDG
ncbi:MAG: hypothetical protein ABSE77_02865 [Acidimicrobiales bacterium]